MVAKLTPHKVETMVRTIDRHPSTAGGPITAAEFYQEVMTARTQLYSIQIQALSVHDGEIGLLQEDLTN
jgi:hypothetical protein